jgi:hypothetical protein
LDQQDRCRRAQEGHRYTSAHRHRQQSLLGYTVIERIVGLDEIDAIAPGGLRQLCVGAAVIVRHTHVADAPIVGAPDRLDFTVVGPAVNLAFWLEGLTKELGRPLLASAAFARHAVAAGLARVPGNAQHR